MKRKFTIFRTSCFSVGIQLNYVCDCQIATAASKAEAEQRAVLEKDCVISKEEITLAKDRYAKKKSTSLTKFAPATDLPPGASSGVKAPSKGASLPRAAG